jgi:hypothetical protein
MSAWMLDRWRAFDGQRSTSWLTDPAFFGKWLISWLRGAFQRSLDVPLMRKLL